MLLLAVHAVLCISGVLAAGEREFPRSQGNPEHRKAYKRCWSQISEAVVGKPPCGVHHAPGNVSSTRTNPGRTPSNAKVQLLTSTHISKSVSAYGSMSGAVEVDVSACYWFGMYGPYRMVEPLKIFYRASKAVKTCIFVNYNSWH